MTAIWYDSGTPWFLAPRPIFGFHEFSEIHMRVEIAAPSYAMAMAELREIEELRGAAWYQHNAELAHIFWGRKKPWWL